MQYSKIFSAVAIFVAAVAAAPACAPAGPAGPALPGVPGIPGGPNHPTTGTSGVPTTHDSPTSGACASSSEYAYSWCCTADFSCVSVLALVGAVVPVCPSINSLVSNPHCCSTSSEQEINQTSGSSNGGIASGNNIQVIQLDALKCIL